MTDLHLEERSAGDVVDAYVLRLSCPRCGAPAEHVADGAPSPGGGRLSAVARCSSCRAELVIHISISAGHGRPVPGTRAPRTTQEGPAA